MKAETKKKLKTLIELIGITVAVYLFMRLVLPAVIPFLIAAGIAAILHPLVMKLMERTGMKEKYAIGSVFVFAVASVLSVAGGIVFFVCRLLKRAGTFLTGLEERIVQLKEQCETCIFRLCGNEKNGLGMWIMTALENFMENIENRFTNSAMQVSFLGIRTLAGGLMGVLIVSVSTLLILHDYGKLEKICRESVIGQRVKTAVSNMGHAGGSYFLAQFKITLCITGICIVGLFLSGNRAAIQVGILIGICDAMPFLGTGTVFLPWALINVINLRYKEALFHVLTYAVCLVTRQYLEPKIIGKGIGIPPLFILMSIYIGIYVYGGWGVILGPASVLLIRECYRLL